MMKWSNIVCATLFFSAIIPTYADNFSFGGVSSATLSYQDINITLTNNQSNTVYLGHIADQSKPLTEKQIVYIPYDQYLYGDCKQGCEFYPRKNNNARELIDGDLGKSNYISDEGLIKTNNGKLAISGFPLAADGSSGEITLRLPVLDVRYKGLGPFGNLLRLRDFGYTIPRIALFFHDGKGHNFTIWMNTPGACNQSGGSGKAKCSVTGKYDYGNHVGDIPSEQPDGELYLDIEALVDRPVVYGTMFYHYRSIAFSKPGNPEPSDSNAISVVLVSADLNKVDPNLITGKASLSIKQTVQQEPVSISNNMQSMVKISINGCPLNKQTCQPGQGQSTLLFPNTMRHFDLENFTKPKTLGVQLANDSNTLEDFTLDATKSGYECVAKQISEQPSIKYQPSFSCHVVLNKAGFPQITISPLSMQVYYNSPDKVLLKNDNPSNIFSTFGSLMLGAPAVAYHGKAKQIKVSHRQLTVRDSGFPGGSYLNYCKSIEKNGDVISADCYIANWVMQRLSVNYATCEPNSTLSDAQFYLSCDHLKNVPQGPYLQQCYAPAWDSTQALKLTAICRCQDGDRGCIPSIKDASIEVRPASVSTQMCQPVGKISYEDTEDGGFLHCTPENIGSQYYSSVDARQFFDNKTKLDFSALNADTKQVLGSFSIENKNPNLNYLKGYIDYPDTIVMYLSHAYVDYGLAVYQPDTKNFLYLGSTIINAPGDTKNIHQSPIRFGDKAIYAYVNVKNDPGYFQCALYKSLADKKPVVGPIDTLSGLEHALDNCRQENGESYCQVTAKDFKVPDLGQAILKCGNIDHQVEVARLDDPDARSAIYIQYHNKT